MKYTVITVLFAFLSVVSCNDFKEGFKQGYEDAKAEAEMEDEENEDAGVKLYVLDGGTVMVNKLGVFSQGDKYEGESREFADPIYIIEHPQGRLLWDAGLAENLVGQEPFTTPDGNFTVSRQDSIVSQLAKGNLETSDFDYLALSHTHFDHSGSASRFRDATWLVQSAEHDFVMSDQIKNNQPDMYNAVKNLTKIQKLNGDHDVFGDGKVVIKSMPGHTPGHQALYIELENEGPILLTGDLYHFEENREGMVVPSFNTSVQKTKESMEAFEAFAKEKNARVIIQHSKKDFDAMLKFPKAID